MAKLANFGISLLSIPRIMAQFPSASRLDCSWTRGLPASAAAAVPCALGLTSKTPFLADVSECDRECILCRFQVKTGGMQAVSDGI
jgi:hypothetical protein